jgi:hypothetical protein
MVRPQLGTFRLRVSRKHSPGGVVYGPRYDGKQNATYDRLLARQKGAIILPPGPFEQRIGWGQPHPRSGRPASEDHHA